ncbi:esterase/lipase family protein [Arhodomonas sp. SL1]|uniref:esterase/lipase family protein n=1 Tax=Arhodomonas sp. SL1 TaxID=3425691 RepID=UPI003F884613
MVARLEGALIALELLIYVVAGATAIAGGAELGLVVIALVGVALAGRAAYVITAFVLARHRDPSAPRLAAGPTVLALAGEWLALTLTHGPLQAMVYPLLRRHLPCPGDKQAPLVILVHGYCCNGGYWLPAWWRLRRRGVAVLPPPTLEPAFGSIDEQADALHAVLAREVQRYPGRPFVLVGHSMGGLIIRACHRRHGLPATTRFVLTLATPHRGTALARRAWGHNGRQLRPGNDWLRSLEADGALAGGFTAMAARQDELIRPWDSALPLQARERRVIESGHLLLGWRRPVLDAIAAASRGSSAHDPPPQ